MKIVKLFILILMVLFGISCSLKTQTTDIQAVSLVNTNSEAKSSPTKLEQRIATRQKYNTSKTSNKYAVLINGSSEERFRVDLVLAYQILLENGFVRDNIYILDFEGHSSFFYPVVDSAQVSKVKEVFEHLSKVVTQKDLLFVLVTDHGSQTYKIVFSFTDKPAIKSVTLSTIVLLDGHMDQREFAGHLNKVRPRLGIALFGQCFSGGFAEEIGKKNFFAVAADQSNQESSVLTNDSFVGFFMQSLREKENSDTNKDGLVSMEEAFQYAKSRHTWSRSGEDKPLIKSDLDPKATFLR